jgi:2-polyprenyl-3-methyl-5-hydroxy-6-metoxy-1,4-benzoquinol methylase
MEIGELINSFFDKFSRERGISRDKINNFEPALVRLKDILYSGKINASQAGEFLDKENNFIVESFLEFIKPQTKKLPRLLAGNIKIFAEELARRPVTPKDYDERIQLQSLEFQIDNYYKPKDRWAKNRIDAVLNALDPQANELILDIGCGVGTFSYRIALAGGYSIGIDYSIESIKVAKELAGKFGLSKKTIFIVSNATASPFKSKFFNKIVCADFIEHIGHSDKILLLDEIGRVVKDEGAIVIFTPNGIREWLGCIKRRLISVLNKKPAAETRLHFGLTNRFAFERLLKQKGFFFKRYYVDASRPILASIPLLKEALSMHILWKICKIKG